jgi:hypothetical protein
MPEGSSQMTSHYELHDWQRNFALAAQRDHAQLLEAFMDIRIQTDSNSDKLDIHTNLLRMIMALLQDVRNCSTLPWEITI